MLYFKLLMRSSFCAALCLMGVGFSSSANAQSYAFTTLDTLGGTFSSAQDINNYGQVAGMSDTSGGAYHAAVWGNGTPTDLGTLAGYTHSYAYGINDAGQVVGRSMSSTVLFEATLWSGDTITDLGAALYSAPGGNNYSTASAINNSGQAAGYYRTSLTGDASSGGQFMWSAGSAANLGQSDFSAPGINDAGQVAGSSGDKAVLWSSGTTTVLGALPGSVWSYAYAINNRGQIVGDSIFCGACNDRATLWSNGTATDLGTLGGTDSNAVDINDAGQIVGTSKTSGGDYHATLWNGGAIFDLNSFLNASSIAAGWALIDANAINDNGWIVGDASNSITGEYRGFIMTPNLIPEPETYAMLLAGLGLLGFLARRRKQ